MHRRRGGRTAGLHLRCEVSLRRRGMSNNKRCHRTGKLRPRLRRRLEPVELAAPRRRVQPHQPRKPPPVRRVQPRRPSRTTRCSSRCEIVETILSSVVNPGSSHRARTSSSNATFDQIGRIVLSRDRRADRVLGHRPRRRGLVDHAHPRAHVVAVAPRRPVRLVRRRDIRGQPQLLSVVGGAVSCSPTRPLILMIIGLCVLQSGPTSRTLPSTWVLLSRIVSRKVRSTITEKVLLAVGEWARSYLTGIPRVLQKRTTLISFREQLHSTGHGHEPKC